MKKAGSCSDGGWQQFKVRLLENKAPQCSVCLAMVNNHDLTNEKILESLDQEAQKRSEKPNKNPTKGDEQTTPAADTPADVPAVDPDDPELDELEKCKRYIRSHAPIIELVEAGAFYRYKCTVCTSRTQPYGKNNKLGRNRLKDWTFFVGQRIDAPSHQSKMKKYQERKDTEAAEAAAKETSAPLADCNGFCLTRSDSLLHMHKDEFRLWVTHCNFEGARFRHTYFCDMSSGEWWIRHRDCCKKIRKKSDSEEETICEQCRTLRKPDKVQRNVVRFCLKYQAGKLLHRRLFASPDDISALISEVDNSVWGQRHHQIWQKIKDLKPVELQQFVRKSFSCIPSSERSEVLSNFIATTIKPALEVHATALSQNLLALSNRYVQALECEQLNELETLNVQIAQAAVSGRLDKNPMMQGLLVQCLNKIEKQERRVHSNRGRPASSCSDTGLRLVEDAAMNLAIAGGNRQLCEQLGQKVTPPRIRLEDLESHSLPNPALALMKVNEEQLEQNFTLVDAKFPRSDKMPARRLLCAVDCTYLLRSLCQVKMKDEAGLVGAPWRPSDETKAFLPLSEGGRKSEKACVMLECVTWDPCSPHNKETYSVAAMPMALSAPAMENQPLTHSGNVVP